LGLVIIPPYPLTVVMESDRNMQQKMVYNWGKGNYNAVRQELGSIN